MKSTFISSVYGHYFKSVTNIKATVYSLVSSLRWNVADLHSVINNCPIFVWNSSTLQLHSFGTDFSRNVLDSILHQSHMDRSNNTGDFVIRYLLQKEQTEIRKNPTPKNMNVIN